MLVAVVAASGKDIKTVVLTTTPPMHCESCENRIKEGLRFVKGVKDVQTSVPEQKVAVTYDADKTSVEKLQKALEKAGYQSRVKDGTGRVECDEHSACEQQ